MIVRLRRDYTEEELQAVYAKPNDYTHWQYHVCRVNLTISWGLNYFTKNEGVVVDLSAGQRPDIAYAFSDNPILGDYAYRDGYQLHGKIEDTIKSFNEGSIDLFILSETIEHVSDPFSLLREIRHRSKKLILSTPDGETTPHNHEHYWGWDVEGMRSVLHQTGWNPLSVVTMDISDCKTQVWVCS